MSRRDEYKGRNNLPTPPAELDLAVFGAVGSRAIRARDGAIQIGGYTLSPLGLQGEGDRADWETVGGLLFDLEGKIQLLIGDWLVYGEREWGETYRQIAEEVGRSVTTLYNYKWVADNVPISLRSEKLSYSHYYLIAGIEDDARKAALIAQAVEEGWTVSQLRRVVYPPTPLLPGTIAVFDLSAKKKQINHLLKTLAKAADDPGKRHQALGELADLETWIAEMREFLNRAR